MGESWLIKLNNYAFPANTATIDEIHGHAIYQPEKLNHILDAVCYFHQTAPDYICTECGTAYCRDCAKLVGMSNVAICHYCDALCHRHTEAVERAYLLLDQNSPFGLDDLKLSLRYPFRYITEIILISALFGACLFLSFTGFPFATLFAHAILLTCTSIVIKRVMTGDVEHRQIFDLSNMVIDLANPMLIGL